MHVGRAAAFIATQLTHEQLQLVIDAEPAVIFFTETFDAWDWAETYIVPILRFRLVFLCVGRFPEQVPAFLAHPIAERVSMIVRLFSDFDVTQLRAQDQVSFGQPYRLYTGRVIDMVLSLPEHYTKDRVD